MVDYTKSERCVSEPVGFNVIQKMLVLGGSQSRLSSWQVFAIAIPMMLASITTPLVGLVDAAVIGLVGDAVLVGGLAAGAVVFDVVFATFNFLRSGTSGVVAQAFGRGDALEERAAVLRAIVVAALFGLVLVLLAPLIAEFSEWSMNAEPAVTSAMDIYIRIRLISAPAALINYATLGYLLGRGDTGIALILQLLLNGVNIVLTIYFGVYLGGGIGGVAWGTGCAEVAAMIAGMFILVRRFYTLPTISPRRTFNVAALKRMLHLNSDIMIRTLVLMGAYFIFTRQSAQLGTSTFAANSVLMHFLLMADYVLGGFATAAQHLAGRAIGARDKTAFLRAVRLTTGWGFAVAAIASLVASAFGEQVVVAITKAPDVRSEAVLYLPWAALTALSGFLSFQMNAVFIGATWSRGMRDVMLVSFAAYITALFALERMFGNHGLWASYHVFLLVRGIGLLWVMRRRVRIEFAQ
ncbi:MATE family efflux transporter [Rhizobium binae]|uniref:MATE family efflux transporter n=1 Tax=Rhizobium binae TaxID=1138190 RepID=UPI0028997D95|nr:MATE family efflux transporter [Rhizobium binae]